MNWCCYQARRADSGAAVKGKFLPGVQQPFCTPAAILFSFPVIYYGDTAGIGRIFALRQDHMGKPVVDQLFFKCHISKERIMYTRTSARNSGKNIKYG
jgi:hypothetical protein